MKAAHRLTECIWFGIMPSPKSPSATSDTRQTLSEMAGLVGWK